MKSITILLATCLLLLSIKEAKAQSLKSLDEITKKHQACLDTGVDMLGCSKMYYLQVDSLLNVAYNQLRFKMSGSDKESLKKEQLAWLKKRDSYFKQQNLMFQRKFEEGEWGSDMAMITYSDQAGFVKERVVVLLKRVNKK